MPWLFALHQCFDLYCIRTVLLVALRAWLACLVMLAVRPMLLMVASNALSMHTWCTCAWTVTFQLKDMAAAAAVAASRVLERSLHGYYEVTL